MDVVRKFGNAVDRMVTSDHALGARHLLLTGYHAQHMVYERFPKKSLPASKQYVAGAVMQSVIAALQHPRDAAMVSLFVPCEPLQVAGIMPYSVETLSGYMTGTKCQQPFLERLEEDGVPDTMCSFHRIFLGAAEMGLMPAPRFMVYTNLACDGNMMTFPYLQKKFDVPSFFIEVPYEKSPESVAYVASQLHEMTDFVANVTGRHIGDEALSAQMARSGRAAENFNRYLDCQGQHYLTGDLTSEMYAVFMNHILLGTEQAEKYSQMLLDDIQKAPSSNATRLLWLHLIPYMQPSVTKLFNFNDQVFITACDLAYESVVSPIDPARPYESMARRMVYSAYNGNSDARIEQALDAAKRTGADGAVIFAHWGCKGTIGASQLMKDELENAGLPTLVLDGDGCDPSNNSDGQITTRLEAFFEMLEKVHR